MDRTQWRRIGELFDGASSLPPRERDAWLAGSCGGDSDLRRAVGELLNHDEAAARDGWLDSPPTASAAPAETAQWRPSGSASGASSTSGLDEQRAALDAASATTRSGPIGFSPRPVLNPVPELRPDDEARVVVQARLRELPIIYILIFGVMLLIRPLFLSSLVQPIVVPFCILAATFVAISGLLWTRPLSLPNLRRLNLTLNLGLAAVLMLYESNAITDSHCAVDRTTVEKILKNIVLLVSLTMLIDAVYVPKGWRQAAAVSACFALLPVLTLLGSYLASPEAVGWVREVRPDGNRPLAVFAIDAGFLLILAAISTFAAHTIARLRSEVIEARRFGQYRLGERIGAGAMGEVYLAEHELLKRPCAVKLIRPEVVARAGTVARFEREVRINATLSHPNTVEIFDYGRTEDGTYYYVMEYLPGLSLASLVERHGPLPPERAVFLLRQVALALQEAHEAGLIHRDIKPSNIIAARRGGMDDVAKLLDFGLVRPQAHPDDQNPASSEEGQILGTPLYMSPEQATGSRTLDARSDIYSLGAVAYFLLTGRPPFDERTAIEAIIAHARDPVVPPSARRPGLPSDLDTVILRCLAKDPADRFPDAEALHDALDACGCAGEWTKTHARRWWQV